MEFDKFHRPLGRVNYNRNVDYTKTCLHNPILVRNVDPEESDQPIQTGTCLLIQRLIRPERLNSASESGDNNVKKAKKNIDKRLKSEVDRHYER